jgi:hypothetical protein
LAHKLGHASGCPSPNYEDLLTRYSQNIKPAKQQLVGERESESAGNL